MVYYHYHPGEYFFKFFETSIVNINFYKRILAYKIKSLNQYQTYIVGSRPSQLVVSSHKTNVYVLFLFSNWHITSKVYHNTQETDTRDAHPLCTPPTFVTRGSPASTDNRLSQDDAGPDRRMRPPSPPPELSFSLLPLCSTPLLARQPHPAR